jgi:cellulose synthase/poly-beta-1,6-N-acetylglucosamine synthase-like glycosyltransferase
MTNAVEVTVVLLTCNRSEFLREALRGVLQQSFGDWKLLASDCSDDPQTRTEVAQIMQDHTRRDASHQTIIVQQSEKVSQAEHLRRVLCSVTTPFVALLDDDDVWLPQHLERAWKWLRDEPLNGLAISRYYCMDKDGRVAKDSSNQSPPQPPDPTDRRGWLGLELRSFFGATSGFVFRREAITNHRFFTTPAVDVHLAISILLNGYLVIGFPEPTLLYRVHDRSSYQKGEQLLLDRHELRLWLFWHQGWRITGQYPLFPLLVIKSALAYLRYRFCS